MSVAEKLLATLERLLALPVGDLPAVLTSASDLVAEALRADKVDAFLHDPSRNTLVAIGSSRQALSQLQRKHGLDTLTVANGGRTVEVFATGNVFLTGRTDEDAGELRGIRDVLQVRSQIGVPLEVGEGSRRGVLLVASGAPDFWTEADARFLQAVARWVGALAHRAEMLAEIQEKALAAGRRRAADELVTVVAHDLRNFIYPIDLSMQLVGRRAEGDGREADVRDVTRARNALRRLGSLVNDILDVARIDQGLLTLEPRACALLALVEEIAATMTTPEHPVLAADAEEVVVQADPTRLRQCLENLVSNAARHSPKSAPIELTVRREGALVCVVVTDRGPGVDPVLLPHLFERGVVGKKRGSGLGLGLYLASNIAKLHGGSLTVEAPGEGGARFVLCLPSGDARESVPPPALT